MLLGFHPICVGRVEVSETELAAFCDAEGLGKPSCFRDEFSLFHSFAV